MNHSLSSKRPAIAPVRLTLAALCLAALAACSGGGSTPAAPKAPAGSAPAKGAALDAVTITLPAPHAAKGSAKRRDYVSVSTVGVILSVADATAGTTATYGYDVSPAAPGETTTSCAATAANGTRSCELDFPAGGGDSVTLSATIYDAVPSPLGANPTAAGHELATGTSAATTIVTGQNNTIAVTLHGLGARLETEVLGSPDVVSFEKVPYVQFHVVDYDGNPIDAYDASDPFVTPVTAAISDHGDTTACATHCMAFNFALTTLTTSIAQPSNGNENDEEPQLFLSFSQSTGSTNGTGDEAGMPPYYAEVVASPNTGASATDATQSGIAYVAPLFGYPATLSLTGATPGLVYADQFMLPSGSSGYTVDASACAGIATAGAAQTAAYGAKFQVTGLTNGSCTLTLYDGVFADQATSTVAVSGFPTHPVTFVTGQSAKVTSAGAAVSSVTATLPAAPAAGDTVLLVCAQGASTTALGEVATPAGYTSIANRPTYSNYNGYAVFAKDVAATDPPSGDRSVTVAFPAGQTGALACKIAEYANTSASLVSSATDNHGATSSPSSVTPTITPDATNAYLITGASSAFYQGLTSADPYTATSGYTETFATGGTSPTGTDAASLDVQEKTLGSSVAAVSNTFTASVNLGTTTRPTTTDFIFFLRPAQ